MLRGLNAIAAIFGLAAAIAGGGAINAQQAIKIGTQGSYAPFNYIEGGQLVGFEIDLGRDLCRRMSVKCEFVAQDFDRLIPGLNDGKFDLIMAAMNSTAKRREVINFSRAYAVEPVGFVTDSTGPVGKLPGTGQYFDLTKDLSAGERAVDALVTSLQGKTIGVQGGTSWSDFVRERFGKVSIIKEYQSTEQQDLDLLAHRIDAGFTGVANLATSKKKPEFAVYEHTGPLFSGQVLGDGYSVGFRKRDDELRRKLDQAIVAAASDGTIKALSLKWLNVDLSPR